jgi:hypothetical protein
MIQLLIVFGLRLYFEHLKVCGLASVDGVVGYWVPCISIERWGIRGAKKLPQSNSKGDCHKHSKK